MWYNSDVKWRYKFLQYGGASLATNINIKQMNWSDYRTNSGNLKEKYLIYIQDKNFYIQHDPKNYIQAAMTQYFIVYGSVQNITKVINATPGLYLILENLGATIGDLWYHDGDKKWAAIGGSGISGVVTMDQVLGLEDELDSLNDQISSVEKTVKTFTYEEDTMTLVIE